MKKCLTSEFQGLVTLPEMTAWLSNNSPDVRAGSTPLTIPALNVVKLSNSCPESILLTFQLKWATGRQVPGNGTILL